jgi:hypothetical protein
MLLNSAERSCSGQRSLRLSTTCKGLPLLSNVCSAFAIRPGEIAIDHQQNQISPHGHLVMPIALDQRH